MVLTPSAPAATTMPFSVSEATGWKLPSLSVPIAPWLVASLPSKPLATMPEKTAEALSRWSLSTAFRPAAADGRESAVASTPAAAWAASSASLTVASTFWASTCVCWLSSE